MKTNLLKFSLIFISFVAPTAWADDVVCLRELLPLTDKASFRKERKGFEEPFIVGTGRYIVFPEVREGKVTGFFVYGDKKSKYYDAVQSAGQKKAKSTVVTELRTGLLYRMVAQPDGLETLTIAFSPAGKSESVNRTPSSAALGASMLPVVGAFAALQELNSKPVVYSQPAESNHSERVSRLVQMVTIKGKSAEELMRPLRSELEMRINWIRDANIDDATFKDLHRVLSKSCGVF